MLWCVLLRSKKIVGPTCSCPLWPGPSTMQLRVLVSAAVCLLFASVSSAACTELLLVAFGDSLTDNGNFYNNHTLGNEVAPLSNVYWEGRFTNAPGTWADQLPGLNKKVQVANFAFGGALACPPPQFLPAPANIIPDLAQQIDLYNTSLDDNSFQQRRSFKQVVPVIWTGHNDLQVALSLPPAQAALVPAAVVQCILSGAETLLVAGYKAIVVASLGPVNLTPLAELANAVNFVTNLLQPTNTLLQAGAQQLQIRYPDSQVVFWDINPVMADVVKNPGKYGFTNTSPQSCVVGGSALHGIAPQSICSNPQDYVFFDDQHPTSKGHAVVANSLISTLKSANLLCTSLRKGRMY